MEDGKESQDDYLDLNLAKDNKIVNAYICKLNMDLTIDIPNDITILISMFYHEIIKECFQHFNPKTYELTQQEMVSKKIEHHHWRSVCYGSTVIPSMIKCI